MANAGASPVFKILLIGDSGVGKSSILIRFTEDNFEESVAVTIGVDFKSKVMHIDGKDVQLSIWDTAGQEKFRSLTSSYYRGTQGIILVYDVSRRSSFEALETWLSEVNAHSTNPDVITLLVANKTDLESREVTKEEGQRWAKAKSMMYIEASAKTKLGVQQAFEELVMKILQTPSLLDTGRSTTTSARINGTNQNEPAGCAC